MATKVNNIKVSTMISSKQYTNLNSEIVKSKLNKEKEVSMGEVIRRVISHYFKTKNWVDYCV